MYTFEVFYKSLLNILRIKKAFVNINKSVRKSGVHNSSIKESFFYWNGNFLNQTIRMKPDIC